MIMSGHQVDPYTVGNFEVQRQFVIKSEAMKARMLKVIEHNKWILAGKECTVSKFVSRPVPFSKEEHEKWDRLINQFVLLHYYIREPTLDGPTEEVFAKFLDNLNELNPDIIGRVKEEAAHRNIQLSPPPCHIFEIPVLKHGKTPRLSSIRAYIHATAKFLDILVDDNSDAYKRVRDGIYKSMGLTSPEEEREQAAAKKKQRKLLVKLSAFI